MAAGGTAKAAARTALSWVFVVDKPHNSIVSVFKAITPSVSLVKISCMT